MLAIVALLKENNIQVNADSDGLYQFTISISTSEIKFEQIVEWLKNNSQSF